jgi:large conductance mechanosensitive channel
MSVVKEFKEFALKGNVVDLAVGVIIGGAFGKVVTALVEKIFMPPLGFLIGGVDFSQLSLAIKEAGPDGKGAVVVGYGDLIQNLVNFLIVAWALFIVIKGMNALKRKDVVDQTQQAPPPTPEDLLLLREIRDLLKANKS